MIPEWFADTVLLSCFAYVVAGALVLLVHGLLRWRNVPFPKYHVAYLTGSIFVLGGGSMGFGLDQQPISITYMALSFIAQGLLVMTLGYYKEKQSNPSMF